MGTIGYNIYLALFLGCFLNSIAYQSYAAPHPASGSSALVSPAQGLFLINKGFLVKTELTNWQLSESASANKVNYINPKNSTASLSVQSEFLKTDLKLEDYAKRWMKDYSLYGFDLLGTKIFTQNGQRSLVIDLVQRKKHQQIRQVLYLKNKKVVVLTCQDESRHFSNTLSDCNQVARSFEWTDLSRPKAF